MKQKEFVVRMFGDAISERMKERTRNDKNGFGTCCRNLTTDFATCTRR